MFKQKNTNSGSLVYLERSNSRTTLDGVNLDYIYQPLSDHTQKGYFMTHLFYTVKSKSHCVVENCDKKFNAQKIKCKACHTIIHTSCIEKINYYCKFIDLNYIKDQTLSDHFKKNNFKHHWVLNSNVNNKTCGSCKNKITSCEGYKCSRCKNTIHSSAECRSSNEYKTEKCHFGPNSSYIIPLEFFMNFKILTSQSSSLSSKDNSDSTKSINQKQDDIFGNLVVREGDGKVLNKEDYEFMILDDKYFQQRRPLLVFINNKSGGFYGKYFHRKFLWMLNPQQIINLTSAASFQHIDYFLNIKNLHIIIAGGDGSISWVVSNIKNMNWKSTPTVSIIPLGTGNDLSNDLGWNNKVDLSFKIEEHLINLKKATIINYNTYETVTFSWKIIYEDISSDKAIVKNTKNLKLNSDRDTLSKNNNLTDGILEESKIVKKTSLTISNQTEDAKRKKYDHKNNSLLVLNANVESFRDEILKQRSKESISAFDSNPRQHCKLNSKSPNLLKLQNDFKSNTKEMVMLNYFSFGLDAIILKKFQTWRSKKNKTTRNQNKMTYVRNGMNVLTKANRLSFLKNLNYIKCDGKDIMHMVNTFKPAAIILQNNKSYSAGKNIWSDKVDPKFKPKAYNDGLLELVFLTTVQIVSIQLQKSGHRVLQCHEIEIEFNDKVIYQIDGEPYSTDGAGKIIINCDKFVNFMAMDNT